MLLFSISSYFWLKYLHLIINLWKYKLSGAFIIINPESIVVWSLFRLSLYNSSQNAQQIWNVIELGQNFVTSHCKFYNWRKLWHILLTYKYWARVASCKSCVYLDARMFKYFTRKKKSKVRTKKLSTFLFYCAIGIEKNLNLRIKWYRDNCINQLLRMHV